MKKVLFVALHRFDRSPSQRFRFEQYLDFLKENNFQCDLSYVIDSRDDKYFYSSGQYIRKFNILIKSIFKRLRDLLVANRYDIIFVQREAFMLGSYFFEKKYAEKSKLIFDFDDSIWLEQVSESSAPNKNLLWLKNPSKTTQIIKLAHMVFAGNQYLADHAKKYNSNVKVVPTTIDTNYHKPDNSVKSQSNKICIGWTGSKTTIDYFVGGLQILHKIKEKYDDKVYFKLIGDESFKYDPLNIRGIKWTKEDELYHLNSIDIGIMPLPDDKWARGKCGFKGLQYMALEIPAIMSPVGVNKEIIHHEENGYLASSEQDWVDAIEKLINDRELRKKIGKAGRKTVEENYSVKKWKNYYLGYFNELID